MRDAKQLTDFTLINDKGQTFEIIGTYLTPNGHVYLKVKYTDTQIFVNHHIADFKNFLTSNGLRLEIEPTDTFENKNFATNINQTIEV
jgi:hypothetical protein